MHSVSPYTIRCFNPAQVGKPAKDKYCILDRIGQHDAFNILREFIVARTDVLSLVEKAKQVYRFDGVTFDEPGRNIMGWVQAGKYGLKTDIINIDSGAIDFEKAERNADLLRHFFYIHLPVGCDEGVALLHAIRGDGIKTLLMDELQPLFFERTTLKMQMNPLSYDKAFEEWREANTKEIRLVKFTGLPDIAEQILKLGHDEKDVVYKAPKRGALGRLQDFLGGETDQMQLLELVQPQCEQIKVVADLGGRKRTFRVGRLATSGICDIEVPDTVTLAHGNPVEADFKAWCEEIIAEFCVHIYPVKVEVI